MKEFNFCNELREIFEKELLGKITSAGRIYRKLRVRDKEFIRRLKELNIEKFNEKGLLTLVEANENINKLVGDDFK